MAEKFKISNLDLYYGDFHALKNMNGFVFANLEMVFGGHLAILLCGLNMEIMDKQVIVLEQCIAKLQMLVLFQK